MKLTEDAHQILVMTWARKVAFAGRPELKRLFHIPNGGLRSKGEAAKMKAMGVKAGVSDLFLPVMIGDKGGLWIEMKAKEGRVSDEQKAWLEEVGADYAVAVCYGWEEATEAIKGYLAGEWPTVDMQSSVERFS